MAKEVYPQWKEDAMTAANELCYPIEVINKIKRAKTEKEADLILRTARLKLCEV